MPITLASSTATTTTLTFGVGNMGASGTVEMQISTSPNFAFCVSPVYANLPRTTPQTITGLNRACTYYVRARTRLASGLVEDWSEASKARTQDGSGPIYSDGGILIEPALFVIPEPITMNDALAAPITGFPLENLLVDAPCAVRLACVPDGLDWKTYIGWGVGLNVPIDTVALLNTNLSEATTWSLYRSAAANLSTPTLVATGAFRASPDLPGRPGYHGLLRFAEIRSRYWFLEIVSDCPLVHAEHLVVGRGRISKNFSADKSETPLPLTTLERRRNGVPDRQRGLAMRRIELELSAVSETKYETLYGDLHRCANEPVLLVPNMRAGAFMHDRILYGDLSGGRTIQTNSAWFTRSFQVDSLI